MEKKKFQQSFFDKRGHIPRRRKLDNQLRKANLIKDMCNIGDRSLILDVGCGLGLELLAFDEPEDELVGIDLSYALIKRCKKFTGGQMRNSLHLLVADVENLPFQVGTFNLVFSIALLHHLPHPDFALSEMVRVTKYKGKIGISEPNIFNFYCLLLTLSKYKLESGTFTTSPYIKKYLNRLPVSDVHTTNLILTPELISTRLSSLLRKIGDLFQNTPFSYLLSIVNIYVATVESQ